MPHITVRSAVISIAIALGAATLSGCSETPQEKYDNAVAQLKEAREARTEAQSHIKEIEQQIKELRADRNEAQAALEKASDKVGAATQQVNETANDEVLFRTIQREVLNKKAFDKAAISVGVSNRVVTLSGHVADDKTHKRALELARSQPGVKSVVDDLEVRDGSTQAPPENSNGGANAAAGGSASSQSGPSGNGGAGDTGSNAPKGNGNGDANSPNPGGSGGGQNASPNGGQNSAANPSTSGGGSNTPTSGES